MAKNVLEREKKKKEMTDQWTVFQHQEKESIRKTLKIDLINVNMSTQYLVSATNLDFVRVSYVPLTCHLQKSFKLFPGKFGSGFLLKWNQSVTDFTKAGLKLRLWCHVKAELGSRRKCSRAIQVQSHLCMSTCARVYVYIYTHKT